jgi:MFS family permease
MLMGFATEFNQLYILRGIMGVSEAFYMPAGLAMIADYHEGKTRSLAVGIHMTGIYLGQAFGGFGAIFATNFSWQTTFHVFGFIGIAYSLILILFLKEKRDNEDVKYTDQTFFQAFWISFKRHGHLIKSHYILGDLILFCCTKLSGMGR